MTVNVRRLTAADAATCRVLRLRMLRAHPDAFTSSYDEEERHKGHLFGMFTAPEARNRGVGSALIEACLADAALIPGLEQVTLTVTEGNPAERLYAAAGFQRFGVEPRAIRVRSAWGTCTSERCTWCCC